MAKKVCHILYKKKTIFHSSFRKMMKGAALTGLLPFLHILRKFVSCRHLLTDRNAAESGKLFNVFCFCFGCAKTLEYLTFLQIARNGVFPFPKHLHQVLALFAPY